MFNPDVEKVLSIEAWPVNQAQLSTQRLERYLRSMRLTLDLGFLFPVGRLKPPPRVRDRRMLFLEDGSVLEQARSAKLKSLFRLGRERRSVSLRRPGAKETAAQADETSRVAL